jgi:hypothetical protein
VILRDKNDKEVFPGGKIGQWDITARCEVRSGQNGLSIFATRKDKDGNYASDPLNPNLKHDESNPISRLFADQMRPCASFFAPLGAFQKCQNPTDYIAGVNFETNELDCRPVVSTPPETYVTTEVSPNEVCGSTHDLAEATCKPGWIAVSCGYQLSRWSPKQKDSSNAPDMSSPTGPTKCGVIPGGRPGKGVCFKSIATCINLGRIANGN